MFNIKNVIVLISIFAIILPAYAVQDVVEPERSTMMTDFSDYTGERFFKSSVELEKERQQEEDNARKLFQRRFIPESGVVYNFSNRKTTPPIKKLRKKISKAYTNRAERKANKKFADANGLVEEEENSVIKEEAAETQAVMRCKTMKYLPQTSELEAVGGVEITFPSRNTVLTSDRMVFDRINNIMHLYDNVKVVRNGNEVLGEYLKVNLNEESVFVDKPIASEFDFKVHAENGYMFGDTIISTNGKIVSEADRLMTMTSSGFGENLSRMILPREDMAFLINDINQSNFIVKVNDINIKAKATHDTIQLKHAKIYTKTGKKVLSLPSMTFYTNKEKDYFEGNFPEIGSYPEFGMYAGPGVVWETPIGSTLKIMPTVNYKGHFGFGGIGKYKSGTNKTDFGYNTAASNFMIKGYQRLDDDLLVQYGARSYMDEWFLGSSWLGYGGELLYEKGYLHRDFLYPKANLRFRHRASAGFFKENGKDKNNDNFSGYHDMSTARFRYMAELSQTLYSKFGGTNGLGVDYEAIKDRNLKTFDLNLIMQTANSIYGTGDTQFIGRIGPQLVTQYKFWRQELGYMLSAYSDDSPLMAMDRYRYGHSNIYAREYLRLCKYLTLGLYASYKLSNDEDYDFQASKQTKLREATFYVALGPDDFKVNLGWDAIRNSTYFGVSMAMNTKNASLDYQHLEIKNPDNLGKTKDEPNVIKRSEFVSPIKPQKTRATVVDLEDASTVMRGETL